MLQGGEIIYSRALACRASTKHGGQVVFVRHEGVECQVGRIQVGRNEVLLVLLDSSGLCKGSIDSRELLLLVLLLYGLLLMHRNGSIGLVAAYPIGGGLRRVDVDVDSVVCLSEEGILSCSFLNGHL